MKIFTNVIFLFLLAGCASASTATTTIFYSFDFKLALPSRMLDNTKIISTGPQSISVKKSDGSYFSGQIINNDFEGLPDNFDIREYPKYILNIDTDKKLDPEAGQVLRAFCKSDRRSI